MNDTLPIWDDAPWPGLPVLQGTVACDVCVVGIGGSGLAAIHELLDLGKRVVAIDAGAVAGGAAGRNGGFLLAGPADFHHDAIRSVGRDRAAALYRRTLAQIDQMVIETPEAIRRHGSLRVAESQEELDDCREQLEAMRQDDLPAEWYEGPEGRGLRIPTDGVFQPMRRCRIMARRAVDRGARLHEGSPALEIAGDGVVTPEGRVQCDAVIVAVDGRLERLLPELAGRVRTARLQMLATAPTREISTRHAVYSRYGYEYWQQLPDGTIALGGMRDRGGEGEWTDDAVPAEPVQGLLERHLRERLGVTAPVTRRWAGAVGYTESGLPVFEEVRPGVWAIGGYSGTGNVIGAICGRAAARLVATGQCKDRELFIT
jgi:glycine/D-amino acid oxidase-like deaminating enzyme